MIVTNTTFRMAPWADVLWAMDMAWWKRYIEEVREGFAGERMTLSRNGLGIATAPVNHYRNSGGGAVALAIHRGATRVVLLGYDMQYTRGKTHWHGDHPRGLGSAGKISEWPAEFERLKRDHPDVIIINATRETALTCFPRMPLEQALNEPDYA